MLLGLSEYPCLIYTLGVTQSTLCICRCTIHGIHEGPTVLWNFIYGSIASMEFGISTEGLRNRLQWWLHYYLSRILWRWNAINWDHTGMARQGLQQRKQSVTTGSLFLIPTTHLCWKIIVQVYKQPLCFLSLTGIQVLKQGFLISTENRTLSKLEYT